MTKVEVQKFRGDFQLAVAQLEKQYGVNVSLGTIRFDVNGLSAKMKAEKGEKIIRATKDKNDEFEVIKINAKNVKVRGVRGLMSVSPGLLVKK